MRTLYKTTISSDTHLTYFAVEVDADCLYISTTVEQREQHGCMISIDLPLSMARELRTALDELDLKS